MNSIAIISDVHGNLPALEAVLDDIEKENISIIYCLGDLVGYYCYFNEVVELFERNRIPCILGNHDYALVYNEGIISTSKTCTNILKWQLENVSNSCLSFLKSLKPSISVSFEGKDILLVHGGLKDFTNEYLFNVNETYLENFNFEKDILVSGHTHLSSYLSFFNGKKWINPGSVGQPRDGNYKASYAIIDNDFSVRFKRVNYDFNKVINSMANNGFEEYISRGLATGTKIGN